MIEMQFVRLHLIEKGIPNDLVTPSPFIWSKYLNPKGKPFLFQSLTQVMLHGLRFGLLCGSLMWLIGADSNYELAIKASVLGLGMGLVNWVRITRTKRKLDIVSWEKWCSENYGAAP
ncbi:DUF6404 family protein [Vibrio penaeicida]|uniref:Magnesium transporter n=1 Tax=Vibrio penaeicida TaxID=104609 RepID=A0AAV5NRX4_9VIBR|nr:DUF6404 family protein [Vibrio penaeicida]RTZ19376.1 magnesium transporter [Vibrio penaeicida]GLQ72998.1 hypothetical protein GCM10007932_23580 [Vibrio penaeicida]